MRLLQRSPHDSDLIQGIRAGGVARRLHENQLFSKYAYFIGEGTRKHRLSEDESSMAYSDAVLTVIEHICTDRFEGRSELKTYLFQIFNNKCVDHIRKNTTKKAQVHRTDGFDDRYMNLLPDDTRTAVQQLMQQQDAELLGQRLGQLGDKCRQMLMAWGEGYKDADIAEQMSYQSAAVVKTSRLRCMQKLRELYLNGQA
ncbi:RNA polymerase sigma factor [Persicitalea jodogahamensis]|uniref:RNA polymerase sigma factor n=1 Tax=Persicitalea jodogahamensis TaxID=402147 RepID=UPI001677BE3B|nr:RNA polymerase sigma factor [Persicitalea jodogahamensis]